MAKFGFLQLFEADFFSAATETSMSLLMFGNEEMKPIPMRSESQSVIAVRSLQVAVFFSRYLFPPFDQGSSEGLLSNVG